MKKFIKQSGFTLVELLVVISIIVILAIMAFAGFGQLQKRARDARRRSDIKNLQNGMEQRFNFETGKYPPPAGSWFEDGEIPTDPRDQGVADYDVAAMQARCAAGCDSYSFRAVMEESGKTESVHALQFQE